MDLKAEDIKIATRLSQTDIIIAYAPSQIRHVILLLTMVTDLWVSLDLERAMFVIINTLFLVFHLV